MSEEQFRIELTGNPFVDTGLAVIGALKGLDDIKKLTLADLKEVYGNGSQLTEWNSKLKSFTQIFGTNNPLFQTAYGFKKGRGPSDTNKNIYESILKGLLSGLSKSGDGPRCWGCGNRSGFDFAEVCKKAIEDHGKKVPEDKWIGRDWFPLAGSLGSDAQALPAASKPVQICPKCLLSIHYLPLGLILLDGRLAVFQCTAIEFWYELVCDIVDEVKGRIQSGNYETLGGKEGNRAVTRRLLAWFKRLQKDKHYGTVPERTVLYVWRFSNSGASAECLIELVPNPALVFLWDVALHGLHADIEALIESEGKKPRYSLFQCISAGRDYPNLYPEGKKKGASPRLFALYQTDICNHAARALQIAHMLAREMAEAVSSKELKRLQRLEAFKEEKVRTQFRASMIRMAEKGEFTLEDYLDIFPAREGQGTTVGWDGWSLIRFYLHHKEEDAKPEDIGLTEVRQIQNHIIYYAGSIYNHYVREKGKERFQREVLGQVKMGKLGIDWFRSQFIGLAESEEGFTYGHWLKLCKLDDGRLFASELIFQMRLLWSKWIHQNLLSVNISAPTDRESTCGLHERFRVLIERLFADYLDSRGLDRFYRDVPHRLRRKEIGLFWLKERLSRHMCDDVQPLSEAEWEGFLINDEGQSIKQERLFQLHLARANLYRNKKFD